MFDFDGWRTGLSPVFPDSITLQHNEIGCYEWLGVQGQSYGNDYRARFSANIQPATKIIGR
jgi:hypothetical protein